MALPTVVKRASEKSKTANPTVRVHASKVAAALLAALSVMLVNDVSTATNVEFNATPITTTVAIIVNEGRLMQAL